MYGFWPAASDGDDIVVYADETRTQETCTFHALRQQWERKGQNDFLFARRLHRAARIRGRKDYIGAFAVTAGIGCDELAAQVRRRPRRLQLDHDQGAGRPAGRGVRRVPARPGAAATGATARANSFTSEELIEEKYRGIRPAPGYPAQPDHTEKRTLFDLLDAERRTPASRSPKRFAMHPAASVSGLYFAHPQARYFAVDRIDSRPSRRLRPPQRDAAGGSRTLAGAESGV